MADEDSPPWWQSKYTPEEFEIIRARCAARNEEREAQHQKAERDKARARVKWETLHKGKRPSEIDAYVADLVVKGVPYTVLATMAGVTTDRIRQRVRRHNNREGASYGG